MTKNKVPILAELAGGTNSAAYSNEADVREPQFQSAFFSPNYDCLSQIKKRYDLEDLFIVSAGVSSEKWDVDRLCRVASD
jgi:Berberine and berberine like